MPCLARIKGCCIESFASRADDDSDLCKAVTVVTVVVGKVALCFWLASMLEHSTPKTLIGMLAGTLVREVATQS